MTLAGTGAGFGVGRLVKLEYVAQATIWVEGGGRQTGGGDRGPIRQGELLESTAWLDLLKSYLVLDHAVRERRLFLSANVSTDLPPFAEFSLADRFRPGKYRLSRTKDGASYVLAAGNGIRIDEAGAGDSIGGEVGFRWAPREGVVPGRVVDFQVATPRDAALDLSRRLQARMAPDGNFLRVELAGTDRELIAATVNTVVKRYVEVAAQLKREKLSELVRILDEQLRRAEANVRASETALQTFRVRTITLPSDRAAPVAAGLELTRDPVFSSFFNLRIELEQVRRDREAVERGLTVPDSALITDALEVIGAVQRSSELTRALQELTEKRAELRALQYRYTNEHPPVQRLTADITALERQTIPATAAVLIQELRAREAELDTRIGSASQELEQIPPRAIQEARLERDVEISGNLYTMLQQRYEEARLAEASSIPDIRVLDAAVVPERPLKNRALQFLAMGLLGGLGLGLVGAILLDRLDRKLRYPEQVTADMGLPILGVVPHLKGVRNGNPSTDSAPVIEALRGIRMNLVHAHGVAGPIVVTITSPGSADGKSFVAANLALSFTNAGHRVLLIDGDSRRGTLHRVLKARRKPGLTDFLQGRVSRAELVSETAFGSLHFIGSGTRSKEAPELLGSAEMPQLMATLRSSYSVIIVDSPPLGAGVDAYALATWTGNLLLVLRTGATDRQFAEAKLEVLDRLPVRVLGAVLNGVKEWNVYRYYSYYLPGYEHEEGDEKGSRRLLEGGVSEK